MKTVLVVLLVLVYNLILIIGTAYLVFYKGISPWWFLVTATAVASGVNIAEDTLVADQKVPKNKE